MAVMHSLYRESGSVRIDPETCTLCGRCVQICPADVLAMEDGAVVALEDAPFGCLACGHCMMTCPEGAIAVTGRGLSPDDLMPLPTEESRAGADQLEALMRSRRSVRQFTEEGVAPGLLDRIVEMASTAPMGVSPWDIGCVTMCGSEEVQKLAAEVVKGYEGFLKIFRPWVLKVMRPFVGREKYDMFAHFIRPLAEAYVDGWREGRVLVFYEAPALLVFHHSPYAESTDAVIACTYAMLAAESLGLGTTMIGGAPPIMQRNPALCRSLGIPEGNTPAIALIVGHPDTQFQRTVRRHFTSVSNVPTQG